MRCIASSWLVVLTGICGIGLLSCRQEKPPTQLVITNPSAFDRTDELIVLKRTELGEWTAKIYSGEYALLTDSAGRPVVIQYDDLDGDREWDEMAFLQSLPANGSVRFSVRISDKPATVKAVVRAHVRHSKLSADSTFGPSIDKDTMPVNAQPTDFTIHKLPPYLTEGPAWENDRVGFRLYFDVRNGRDIWGKTTHEMVLDRVGADTTDDYHHRAGWGMDILKVGNSLGAGAIALKVPLPDNKDTLVKLGGANIGNVTYTKIADGPVRAIFRMQYDNWKVHDSLPPVTVTEEISIWGGQYFYTNKVTVNQAPDSSQLVTGIVNLHSSQALVFDTAGCQILFTYDRQSENNDRLGMAIMMPPGQEMIADSTANEGPGIINTYTAAVNIPAHSTTKEFRFFAGWELSDARFQRVAGFRNYLAHEAALYSLPPAIKWE